MRKVVDKKVVTGYNFLNDIETYHYLSRWRDNPSSSFVGKRELSGGER